MLPLELPRRATQWDFPEAGKTTGEQIIGRDKKLGELVYKFNTKDQADMYLRTTEAIADFVA
jgi:hypothetical protein